ncbi:hypothetical protein PDG61_20645 [Mycolicibacterium sp. BiH015]|uniref:hypothetical protein n=1 Tax=Mycolicibacterium sp. BiH015 TaxID=3018808 RepID=UPI0022E28118|nr:hypothetical protein [Mycolicibacterium sp. BiH015]MDA2893337.1 hypothetical protein [Mycolicibacterium sp. BiH015]
MPLPPAGPPLRPSDRNDRIVGTSALVLVLLITVTTLWFSRGDAAEPAPPPVAPAPAPTVTAPNVASAGDRDPITLITDEPTCPDWEPINTALATALSNGWQQRDPSVPATEWTVEQRDTYRAVADAMRAAADKTVPLAKATPHRVMRELYGQAIAYWRGYADSIDAYRPGADHLARAAGNAAEAVNAVCAAVDFGAAESRSALVLPGPAPVPDLPLGDPSTPAKYIAGPSAFCAEWMATVAQYADATRAWRERHNPAVPASSWSPEQRALADATAATMQQNADRTELLGLLSGNLVAADFAALASHYRRAFAVSLPDYALPDSHLDNAALRLQALTNQACHAVQQ